MSPRALRRFTIAVIALTLLAVVQLIFASDVGRRWLAVAQMLGLALVWWGLALEARKHRRQRR